MTTVTKQIPVEIYECGRCGNRAETFLKLTQTPVCANKHDRRQMVRIWDREAGGSPPPRGGEDADV